MLHKLIEKHKYSEHDHKIRLEVWQKKKKYKKNY